MSGSSRFIEGQNVIFAKIMHKKRTGEKTYLSYKQENPLKKQQEQRSFYYFISVGCSL